MKLRAPTTGSAGSGHAADAIKPRLVELDGFRRLVDRPAETGKARPLQTDPINNLQCDLSLKSGRGVRKRLGSDHAACFQCRKRRRIQAEKAAVDLGIVLTKIGAAVELGKLATGEPER